MTYKTKTDELQVGVTAGTYTLMLGVELSRNIPPSSIMGSRVESR